LQPTIRQCDHTGGEGDHVVKHVGGVVERAVVSSVVRRNPDVTFPLRSSRKTRHVKLARDRISLN
jgi:hypothetical protein